jgi:hypothetical protein
MDKKPPLDPSLYIPIIIGVGSICGIVLVLLGLRLSAAQGGIQTVVSDTPVKFQYLGTEPGIALPTGIPSLETEESPTLPETPTEIFFPPPTEILSPPPTVTPALTTITQALTTTPISLATDTPVTRTVTAQPLGITYDDADSRIAYTGNWIGQSGVNGTYKNTLHISSTIGDALQLIFYGQKLQLAYQAGPSLGTIAIRLDSTDFVLDQSSPETRFSQWESPVLTFANHTITITHISGGSVNIDSLAVIDLATPTASQTATPTPTQ